MQVDVECRQSAAKLHLSLRQGGRDKRRRRAIAMVRETVTEKAQGVLDALRECAESKDVKVEATFINITFSFSHF